jgi:hypothetical protein
MDKAKFESSTSGGTIVGPNTFDSSLQILFTNLANPGGFYPNWFWSHGGLIDIAPGRAKVSGTR